MAKGASEDRLADLLICLLAAMDDGVGWRKRLKDGEGGGGGGGVD